MIEPTIVYINAERMNVFYDSERLKFFGQDDDKTTVMIHFNQVEATKLRQSLDDFLGADDAR